MSDQNDFENERRMCEKKNNIVLQAYLEEVESKDAFLNKLEEEIREYERATTNFGRVLRKNGMFSSDIKTLANHPKKMLKNNVWKNGTPPLCFEKTVELVKFVLNNIINTGLKKLQIREEGNWLIAKNIKGLLKKCEKYVHRA